MQWIVVVITMMVLVALFSVQFLGTARVGGMFGPVTGVWFLSIGALGISQIVREPQILAAFHPYHGWHFLSTGGFRGFVILGSVFLAVTGTEAVYADMGHFGAGPIRRAWFALALPALALNYMGQGALLLRDPGTAHAPFFLAAPGWAMLPLVVLATMATVIASQALITGTYSLTLSAVQLGYLPRMSIRHTSEHTRGQIFIPMANRALMCACLALVLAFRHSSALAAAYGVAVIQRRRGGQHTPEILAGPLTLDLLHHEASLGGEPLKLTPTEFALLTVLVRHAGRVVTQNQIIKQVWPGQQSDPGEGLRVHLNHLRNKLGTRGVKIVNEPGIGYRLVETQAGQESDAQPPDQ